MDYKEVWRLQSENKYERQESEAWRLHEEQQDKHKRLDVASLVMQ
jgi:hypothetical protein